MSISKLCYVCKTAFSVDIDSGSTVCKGCHEHYAFRDPCYPDEFSVRVLRAKDNKIVHKYNKYNV